MSNDYGLFTSKNETRTDQEAEATEETQDAVDETTEAEVEETADVEVDKADEVETITRVKVDGVLEEALDATLAFVRSKILDGMTDDTGRKGIPITPAERRKVRLRHVTTDVSISDLVHDAVLALLKDEGEIPVATARAAKNRTERVTLTEPTWWWKLVNLAAEANDASPADVIAAAVRNYLS